MAGQEEGPAAEGAAGGEGVWVHAAWVAYS